MSLIKIVQAQFGQQTEAVKNFTWTAEDADGSIQLKRGVPGAYTDTILEVRPDGSVHFLSGASAVGPVTQTGGVPTGAIIESGSNANGNYTKFADGTLICCRPLWKGVGFVAANTFLDVGTLSLPAQFSSVDYTVSASMTYITNNAMFSAAKLSIENRSTNSVHMIFNNASGATYDLSTLSFEYMVIGRWY